MVRLIRATFYSATNMLVGKALRLDSDLSVWRGYARQELCARQMGLSLWLLGDSDSLRSVRVSSRTVYFYTGAGVERTCVEVRPLMALLIGEEMCICGMLQYSLEKRINLSHWHSVQHVRHILIGLSWGWCLSNEWRGHYHPWSWFYWELDSSESAVIGFFLFHVELLFTQM